MFIAPFYRYTR